MKEFSLLGFVEFLGNLPAAVEAQTHEMLELAARVVEREAKDSIGEYHGAAGPFAAWAELADATKADRVAKGYAENEPLLREGDLRDSIEHTVVGNEAHIGSNSDIAVYQELGTSRIPPRSFLGGAAVRKEREVVELIGSSVMRTLSGGGVALPIPRSGE